MCSGDVFRVLISPFVCGLRRKKITFLVYRKCFSTVNPSEISVALEVSLPLLPTHHTVCWHNSVLRTRRAQIAGNNSIEDQKMKSSGLWFVSVITFTLYAGRQVGRQADKETDNQVS